MGQTGDKETLTGSAQVSLPKTSKRTIPVSQSPAAIRDLTHSKKYMKKKKNPNQELKEEEDEGEDDGLGGESEPSAL